MADLEIRWMPTCELLPAPYNPRRELKPTDRAYRKLAESLREFGLVEPLIWNETTGHVVGGHARLRILRDMGVDRVPVSVVRLSPTREKALNVILNNHEAQGTYDPARLADVLEDLQQQDELELSGFDESTLDMLRLALREADDASPPPTPEDRVEVTFVMNQQTYKALWPALDELAQTHDIVTHIREA